VNVFSMVGRASRSSSLSIARTRRHGASDRRSTIDLDISPVPKAEFVPGFVTGPPFLRTLLVLAARDQPAPSRGHARAGRGHARAARRRAHAVPRRDGAGRRSFERHVTGSFSKSCAAFIRQCARPRARGGSPCGVRPHVRLAAMGAERADHRVEPRSHRRIADASSRSTSLKLPRAL